MFPCSVDFHHGFENASATMTVGSSQLRKLDGLSSKNAHASSRVSMGSTSRANSPSRPGTPAKSTTTQQEGINGKRVSQRISTRVESSSEGKQDSTSSSRNRTREHSTEGGELHIAAMTSNDANGPPL